MNATRGQLLGNQKILGVGPRWAALWPRFRFAFAFCLFEVAFYFAYRFGMSFGHAFASPFWFPDSVLLCALLASQPRRWWLIVLGALPIRLFVEVPPGATPWFLLMAFAIDSAKGLLGAMVMRRFFREPLRIQTMREFAIFCFFVVLLIPAASAFGGAAARHMLGYDYWTTWMQWLLGDVLAQLIVTPAILYWTFGGGWKARLPAPKRLVEGGALTIGLIVAASMAFSMRSGRLAITEPWFYAPVPFLFWAGLRFGMLGASGAMMTLALFAVEGALKGRGPFFDRTPGDTAFFLQRFLLLRAAPLYLVAVLVEQGKVLERSRRESEERFRNMANTSSVMLWMSGTDKLCEFFNKGWLDFTGRTIEQETGNGWAEGVHRDDLAHCLDIYQTSFDARQNFEMEYRLRRYDGEYRWVLDRGSPRYGPNGEFAGYIGSAIDITDRKRAEEADRNLAHAMRLAAAGELTAMVAHEITQPLAAILSNADAAELLLESESPPLDAIREIFDDIRRDDLRAHEAICRVRRLMHKGGLEMRALDMNETAGDVLRLVAGDAMRRHVQIWRGFSQDLPPALGDRAALQQVLLNLILNGMDAMKDTPLTERYLTVETKLHDQDTVEVTVTDRGNGIDPERIPHIFESFFTTKEDGMGLGLSIARSIVESHRGRIWVENNFIRGATFHFTVHTAEHAVSTHS